MDTQRRVGAETVAPEMLVWKLMAITAEIKIVIKDILVILRGFQNHLSRNSQHTKFGFGTLQTNTLGNSQNTKLLRLLVWVFYADTKVEEIKCQISGSCKSGNVKFNELF